MRMRASSLSSSVEWKAIINQSLRHTSFLKSFSNHTVKHLLVFCPRFLFQQLTLVCLSVAAPKSKTGFSRHHRWLDHQNPYSAWEARQYHPKVSDERSPWLRRRISRQQTATDFLAFAWTLNGRLGFDISIVVLTRIFLRSSKPVITHDYQTAIKILLIAQKTEFS